MVFGDQCDKNAQLVEMISGKRVNIAGYLDQKERSYSLDVFWGQPIMLIQVVFWFLRP